MNVEYPSNKYYESTTITIQFLINRRTVKCILDKEYYEQYPGKILNITARLLDTENNKPISNCIVNYFFNDYEFVTQTKNQGYAQITITMPNIDKEQLIYCMHIYDGLVSLDKSIQDKKLEISEFHKELINECLTKKYNQLNEKYKYFHFV